jgi:hypothetical protein
MSNVVNLSDWRREKDSKRAREMNVKDDMRSSLDNNLVKERYKINELSEDERFRRIQERIKRINTLMRELEANNK